MQIFIIGSIFETCQALDKRRLWKQILEARQIIDVLLGKSQAWKNHPIAKMYKDDLEWLLLYLAVFEEYWKGDLEAAEIISNGAEEIKPTFLYDDSYLENMKKRLFTKDNSFYSQWAILGESYINMYFVDGNWKYYNQKN